MEPSVDMPPTQSSRYRFCTGYKDLGGALVLTDPEPYTWRSLADNIAHTVVEGDTLTSIAYRYYSELPGAALLWWVVADFQREGVIYDPTLALVPGTVLAVPSVRVVTEEILNEKRRPEFQA